MRSWREFRSRYNLVGARCGLCGKVYFPGRLTCPACHRDSLGKLEPFGLSGRGSIVTFTTVHEAPRMLENQVPYTLAMVQLDEGPRLTAQLVDVEPEKVVIGQRVRAVFRRMSQDGEAGVINYGFKFTLEK